MGEANFADRIVGQTIVFFGRPVSGKKDQSHRAGHRLQQVVPKTEIKILEMGKLLRVRRSQGDYFQMDKGDYLPDGVVFGVVANFMESVQPADILICDGFPRNREQAMMLRLILNRPRIVAVELLISRQECLTRVASRNEGRTDDETSTALWRQNIYERELPGLRRGLSDSGVPVIKIDATMSRVEVEDQIIKDLGLFLSTPYSGHSHQQVFSLARWFFAPGYQLW